MIICRQCKMNEGTVKDCVIKSNDKIYEYFSCNDCNNTRAKKYRKTTNGKIVYRDIMRRQYINHRQKALARCKVNYMINTGKMVKPEECSICLVNKPVEAHHTDYSKPLDVNWVCRQCHSKML